MAQPYFLGTNVGKGNKRKISFQEIFVFEPFKIRIHKVLAVN